MSSETKPEDETIDDKTSRIEKLELFQKIRQQIFYYFSDSNLKHDKFMRDLTGVNHDNDSELGTKPVSLSAFLKFNKIIELTCDEQDLVDAFKYDTESLKNKHMVFDANSRSIHRTVPYNVDYNAKERTVYVERFALDSVDLQNHIRQLFEPFGEVVSVRTPRHRNSKQLMGFAFLEFKDECAVKRCCDHFMKKEEDSAGEQLRVLSKTEWTNYKNQYLRLQKRAVSLFRVQQANYEAQCEQLVHTFQLTPKQTSGTASTQSTKCKQICTPPPPSPQHNIVKVEFHIRNSEVTPVDIRKSIRDVFEQNTNSNLFPTIQDVAYIDVPASNVQFLDDGSYIQTCFIRTHTSNSAAQINKDYLAGQIKDLSLKDLTLLGEEECEHYWKTVNSGKRNKNKRCKR